MGLKGLNGAHICATDEYTIEPSMCSASGSDAVLSYDFDHLLISLYASGQTDRHTDRDTDTLIAIL